MIIDNDLKVRIQYEWQQLKKTGYQNNKVYIKEIEPKGLGVFAKQDLKVGEVVEMCHTFTLEVPSKYIYDKSLTEYILPGFIKDEVHPSFAFGFGCIYNSSDTEFNRNVEWIVIPESRLSAFIANRDIKRDEELLAWFGEGFFLSRCKPNLDVHLKKQFHKQIDEKLSLVKVPNSNKNILESSLTKMLQLNIVEENNCDIDLTIKNLSENLNNTIKLDCLKYLGEIKGLRNINILFQ